MPSDTPPPSAIRSIKQRRLNVASALLTLLALACFLLMSGFQIWPFVALSLSFTAAMLLLRVARVSWKLRILVTPLVAAAAVVAGATSWAWPSFALSAIGQSLWVAFAASAVLLAAAQILSILSFPMGYGERKA